MSSLILSTESSEGYTSVSNIFISEYVPGANGEFVKVYLYLLHLMSLRSNNISISLLADTFNQTEADIMRALRYWDSLDVISLSFNGPGNGLSNIVLRDIKHTGQAANAMADPIAAESASVNSTSSYQTETVRAAKPDITQQSLQKYPIQRNSLTVFLLMTTFQCFCSLLSSIWDVHFPLRKPIPLYISTMD